MNILLWVLQVLLALAFFAHGGLLLFPPPAIAVQMNASFPRWFWLFLGVAEILAAVNGELDPSRLTQAASDQRNAFVAEATHSDGIGSFVLSETAPMPWTVFSRCMETLMTLRGPDLLRVKGFLDVEGCKGPVAVQFVQHLAHPPVELATWPDNNRQSRVVFITRNISEQHVHDLLKAVRALA